MMKDYLGDGLYAEFDGYQIRLYADREYTRHEVFLEPQVYLALTRFVERIKDAKQEEAEARDAAEKCGSEGSTDSQVQDEGVQGSEEGGTS